MTKQNQIQLFNDRKVRTVWDSEQEEWYFSVVDVVAVLTDSVDPATYWKVLKNRLKKEGNETVTNCNRLKLPANDGKMRLTDVATSQQMFRIIQSIPSPKAEPFKQWMAQVAATRLDQMQDPELSIEQSFASRPPARAMRFPLCNEGVSSNPRKSVLIRVARATGRRKNPRVGHLLSIS